MLVLVRGNSKLRGFTHMVVLELGSFGQARSTYIRLPCPRLWTRTSRELCFLSPRKSYAGLADIGLIMQKNLLDAKWSGLSLRVGN